MSYNKVYFVQIQEKTARGLRKLFPTECFNDYREARKSLKSEVELYGTHFGYDMQRDEYIEDLYSGYQDGVKMCEMTIGGIIIH